MLHSMSSLLVNIIIIIIRFRYINNVGANDVRVQGIADVHGCQNQFIRLGSDKNMAKVVDVLIGATVWLDCNFCGDKDDFEAKLWYYKQRGVLNKSKEIPFNMDNDCSKCKISLSPSHTLCILNFTTSDSGIYTCKHINHDEENIFTYVLDGVFKNKHMPKVGKASQWQEYNRLYLQPLNEKFEKSNEHPFSYIRKEINFTFRIMTTWENWGKCEAYGRNKGKRRKLGKCRLHTFPHSQKVLCSKSRPAENLTSISNYYLIDNYDVACTSIILNSSFPELSEILRELPNFEEIESCNISIPAIKEQLLPQKESYKYHLIQHIAENGHITLICPEVTIESTVEWCKDNVVLNSTFRKNMAQSVEEPHITIDAYNTLYVLHATKNEEGIYDCTVDGVKMQKFDIRVVSKSKLLNQEFIRYSIYLGFVLSLTLSCYCAGICVAWHRRDSFVDPLHLRNITADEK